MKISEKIIAEIICIIIILFFVIINSFNTRLDTAQKVYNVYLDGKKIGAINGNFKEKTSFNFLGLEIPYNKTISGKDALYNLIDNKQQKIKDEYHVSNVYPPSGLQIVENYSYNTETNDLNNIYNKIEEIQDFTVSGYKISVSESSERKAYSFNVLDRQVLDDAIEKFILAFISEEDYQNYLSGNQKDIDDFGILYEDMDILEDIVIKKDYISINDKIYLNSDELAQELLFGFDYDEHSYTIKEGDTIQSISDENVLNTQEFLIANPQYTSKDSLLTVGDKVNITLINPQLSFSYNVKEVEEVVTQFTNEIVRDNTKPSTYSQITTPGVNGLKIQEKYYNVVNGEPNSQVTLKDLEIIREVVNQITTKGKQNDVWGSQRIEDTGTGWRWPTNNPFAITSEFAPRWGKHHNGMDISGTGRGSKIYAANDGVVVSVVDGCSDDGTYGSSCGGGYGNSVVINHGNNYYTLYGHMLKGVQVKVGQTVYRGTVVGFMGNSGSSKGVHLHFGFSIGDPNNGGVWQNPRELYPV